MILSATNIRVSSMVTHGWSGRNVFHSSRIKPANSPSVTSSGFSKVKRNEVELGCRFKASFCT